MNILLFFEWNQHLWGCAFAWNEHYFSSEINIFQVACSREMNILPFLKWNQYLSQVFTWNQYFAIFESEIKITAFKLWREINFFLLLCIKGTCFELFLVNQDKDNGLKFNIHVGRLWLSDEVHILFYTDNTVYTRISATPE